MKKLFLIALLAAGAAAFAQGVDQQALDQRNYKPKSEPMEVDYHDMQRFRDSVKIYSFLCSENESMHIDTLFAMVQKYLNNELGGGVSKAQLDSTADALEAFAIQGLPSVLAEKDTVGNAKIYSTAQFNLESFFQTIIKGGFGVQIISPNGNIILSAPNGVDIANRLNIQDKIVLSDGYEINDSDDVKGLGVPTFEETLDELNILQKKQQIIGFDSIDIYSSGELKLGGTGLKLESDGPPVTIESKGASWVEIKDHLKILGQVIPYSILLPDGYIINDSTDVKGGSGGSTDGVATSGTYNPVTEEITVNVASPGFPFTIDVDALARYSEIYTREIIDEKLITQKSYILSGNITLHDSLAGYKIINLSPFDYVVTVPTGMTVPVNGQTFGFVKQGTGNIILDFPSVTAENWDGSTARDTITRASMMERTGSNSFFHYHGEIVGSGGVSYVQGPGIQINGDTIRADDNLLVTESELAALSITESQISDLDHFDGTDITGTESAFIGWDMNEADDLEIDDDAVTALSAYSSQKIEDELAIRDDSVAGHLLKIQLLEQLLQSADEWDDSYDKTILSGTHDTVASSIALNYRDGSSINIPIYNISGGSGGSTDGVVTGAVYDAANDEFDFTVAAPGSDFSMSTSGLAKALHSHTAADISDFASAVANNAAVAANTAKVSNATHTGDVTGSTALSIANNAVTTAKINWSAVTNGKMAPMNNNTLKGNVSGITTSPADLTPSEVRSMLSLDQVDNTSDADKPISSATAAAINALTTTDIPEGANEYFTTSRARAVLNATGIINYNASTGEISSSITATDRNNWDEAFDRGDFRDYGLGGNLVPVPGNNLDTLNKTGFYYTLPGVIGKPANSNDYGIVIHLENPTIGQATQYWANDSLHYRYRYAGTWGAWVKVNSGAGVAAQDLEAVLGVGSTTSNSMTINNNWLNLTGNGTGSHGVFLDGASIYMKEGLENRYHTTEDGMGLQFMTNRDGNDTNSYIINAKAATFFQHPSNPYPIVFRGSAGTGAGLYLLKLLPDSGMTAYFGGVKKLETSFSGIKAYGTVEASNGNSTEWNTAYDKTILSGTHDTVASSIALKYRDGSSINIPIYNISGGSGGSTDGVVTGAVYDAANDEFDFTVAAPGSDFSMSTSGLAKALHSHTAADISDFASAVASNAAVAANTAKVSNAAHTGDVTGSTVLTITNNAVTTSKINNAAVTNAKLAAMTNNTLKGNVSGSTSSPVDLTSIQVRSMLNISNVDNTSDLNKPVSTATQTAINALTTTDISEGTNLYYTNARARAAISATGVISYNSTTGEISSSILPGDVSNWNGKENAFSKNTGFNKNFGTTAGTVAQGNDSRILNGNTAFGWGDHADENYLKNVNLSASGTTAAWTIASDAGTDAVIPLATQVASGLISPISQEKLDLLKTVAMSGQYSDLINIPEEFNPAPHEHAIGDITGLQDSIARLTDSINGMTIVLNAYETYIDNLKADVERLRLSPVPLTIDKDLSDADVYKRLYNETASGITLIITTDLDAAMGVGDKIILQARESDIDVVASPGITLNGQISGSVTVQGPWASRVLEKIGVNEYMISIN